jgi:hypothetical protein
MECFFLEQLIVRENEMVLLCENHTIDLLVVAVGGRKIVVDGLFSMMAILPNTK